MEPRRRRNDDSEDYPTYSRLFIVCDRRLTENQFKEEFSKFGTIEDIRMPRDHNTGEPKGVVYIKFAKTSEAAIALETMHGKQMCDSNRPLKVMVAANRCDIQSDDQDYEKYKRLFIHIFKNINEDMLEEHFKQFGNIVSITIQRDRNTGESKGFAYIKYRKFSEAAKAVEKCDKMYRAIFASPKSQRRSETSFETNIEQLASTAFSKTSLLSSINVKNEGNFTRVNFMCAPYLNQGQIERLFDIVPGMTKVQFYIDLVRNFGKGTVSYSNPGSAAYAVEKLNKFEYPPGVKIFVRPDKTNFNDYERNFNNMPNVVNNLKTAMAAAANSTIPDFAQLAEAIAEASKLIKNATCTVTDRNIPDSNELHYCSVKLPPPQPLADIDSLVAKRCFLICKPQPPPLTVLKDIFCRFGDLINVYTLPNKTVGYARYATSKAADEAIKLLHGAEICGVRIKVIEADEEAPAKRSRYD